MRSHQNDVAALEQWTPLIHKIAFKAARRAAAIGSPHSHDDFAQELQITVLKCHDQFNPDLGVKMITYLHRAMYNEVNKILRRDSDNVQAGFTVSGDSTWAGDDGQGEAAWDYIEDDCQRSPEHAFMDGELVDWVHDQISNEASAVLHMLQSGNQFLANQLHAYNAGVEMEAAEGGLRRMSLDMNFSFVCKVLGFNHGKQTRLAQEIQNAVASYGAH